MWPYEDSRGFTLGNCLFGTVKLNKDADLNKYSYSGYNIGFDPHRFFSLSDSSDLGKNVIMPGVDNSSSAHVNVRQKHILSLGKDSVQGLEDTALTTEAEYFINFTDQKYKFCLNFAIGKYYG